jgi:hypothetical protein
MGHHFESGNGRCFDVAEYGDSSHKCPVFEDGILNKKET